MNEDQLGCLAWVIGVPLAIFVLGGIVGLCLFGWHETFEAFRAAQP